MAIDKITDATLCCGCGACASACVRQAIVMQENKQGFKYPIINSNRCVECKLCKKVCPANNRSERIEKIEVYAARGKDLQRVISSSSGGIFDLLAEECLNVEGCVFGAIIDSEFKVKHLGTSKSEEIELFKGSKYAQSDLEKVYQEIKELLNKNINVLFSGTPCQVDGLKKILGKEYPTLITVDFICHGVPSPLVFREYIKMQQREFANPIKSIKFRDKRKGWPDFHITMFNDEEEKSELCYKNLYMYGYFHNIYLRESCYNCVYKGKFSRSDITLGDYWAPQGKLVDEFMDRGLSLVFVNSLKGKKYFEAIKEKIDFEEKTKEEVLANHNKHYEESSQPSRYCESFWKLFEKKGIARAMEKYCQDSIYIRMYYASRNILKKILRYRRK